MMKKILFVTAAIVTILGLVGLVSPQAAAAPAAKQWTACDVNPTSDLCRSERSDKTSNWKTVVRNIVNILLYIVGVAAVIVIIISGLRYVISAGNTNAVQQAKLGLIYSVVGLAVAIAAYAIINFVLVRLGAW